MAEEFSYQEEGGLDLSTGKGLEYRQLLLWGMNRILMIGATKLSVDSDYFSQKIAIADAYKEAVQDFEAAVPPEYTDDKYGKDLKKELERYEKESSELPLKGKDDEKLEVLKRHYRNRFRLAIANLGRHSLLIELSGAGKYVEV